MPLYSCYSIMTQVRQTKEVLASSTSRHRNVKDLTLQSDKQPGPNQRKQTRSGAYHVSSCFAVLLLQNCSLFLWALIFSLSLTKKVWYSAKTVFGGLHMCSNSGLPNWLVVAVMDRGRWDLPDHIWEVYLSAFTIQQAILLLFWVITPPLNG